MFWNRKKTPVITPKGLQAAIDENQAPVIVDVRSEKEFEASHLPGAINIPLDELENRRAEIDSSKPTVFY
jgi:rhodanese-related sulfurtransferase